MDNSGYNVSKKRHARGVIGNKHRVTREEAMKWFQQKVGAAHFYYLINCCCVIRRVQVDGVKSCPCYFVRIIFRL